ncbi:hypothetical protein BG07_5812 (plasmid) [Bacillus pseudomycoides]|uniref:hypothetical protein n=1 Tax=Bacillus TaxID=1386 RepID=UPI000362C45D|nr:MULTISPECIES: hypothetical protein [Bacillus]AIK35522.1 hypothetical protein DJ92_5639 [Bacillus pseudomycoides]AJI14448.1 hypothetical protein BG07_5812 [Bacillus pseudomycoides]
MLKKFNMSVIVFVISFGVLFGFNQQADAAINGTLKTSGHVDFYTYYWSKSFYTTDGHVRLKIRSWGPSSGTFTACIASGTSTGTNDGLVTCRDVSVNTGGKTYYYDFDARTPSTGAGTYRIKFYATDYYGKGIQQRVDYWIYD